MESVFEAEICKFRTIRETAKELQVPECRLRAWVKQGRVKGFFSGSRYYINVLQLQDALNRGDFAKPEQEEREEA